jgi:cytochrome c
MRILLSVVAAAVAFMPLSSHAVDQRAAQKLARDSDCLKCHAISKKKEGPSYKEIAKKYKGKPDAESKVTLHITTQPKVKVDGKEELHGKVKSDDKAEIKNLVQWILSR